MPQTIVDISYIKDRASSTAIDRLAELLQQVGGGGNGNAANVTVLNPTSGSTIFMDDTYHSLFINNAAELPLLTIHMPSNPIHGDRVEIAFAHGVTVLNIRTGAGAAIPGAPTDVFGPGAAISIRYLPPWVYWK